MRRQQQTQSPSEGRSREEGEERRREEAGRARDEMTVSWVEAALPESPCAPAPAAAAPAAPLAPLTDWHGVCTHTLPQSGKDGTTSGKETERKPSHRSYLCAYVRFTMYKKSVRTRVRDPTTRYAIPRKSLFPPNHDVVVSRNSLRPPKLRTS